MDYQYAEEQRAGNTLSIVFLIGLIMEVVSWTLCFWPEPDRHGWLILTGVGMIVVVLCMVVNNRYGKILKVLRGEQEKALAQLKATNEKYKQRNEREGLR